MFDADARAPGDQIKCLRDQINGNIGFLDWSAPWSRKRAFCLKLAGVIFGSATTVLIGAGRIGIPDIGTQWLSLSALITSALVSIIAVGESFFGYMERWRTHAKSAQVMRLLLAEFDYCLASPEGISIEKLNEFFGRFLKISQDAYIGRAGDKDPDPNNNDL